MWGSIALVVVSLIFILFYLYRSRNVSYWSKRGVVTASGANWFFGHLKPVMLSKKHMGTLFGDICREFPEAKFIGVYKLSTPGLVVRDADIIKSVLNTDFHCFFKNEFEIDKNVDKLWGANPFARTGEDWKIARSHVTPSLTFAKLKGYFPNITKVGDELVKYMNRKLEDGPYEAEAKQFSSIFTMDVVANAVCGIEHNTFVDSESLFAKLAQELNKLMLLENVWIFIAIFFPELWGKKIRLTSKHIEEVIISLTTKMLKLRSDSQDNGGDIFNQYLNIRKKDQNGVFTDDYIAGHVYGFILDGYETSSIVLCYSIFELAWHEEIQEKLRKEVQNLTSRTNGEYTIDDIEGCKYLDKVISEVLRFHPPLCVMTKQCTSDFTIPAGSNLKTPLTLKPGNLVYIPVHEIHMDPEHYENPDTFDPERFDDEIVSKRHKYVYLPFGEGPRKCLGMRFGLLQTKVALIKIISNYRLKPSPKTDHNVQLDPKIIIVRRPLGGAWVTFEKIN